MKVRIIDKNDPLCGQEFDGSVVYYDYYHGRNEMFGGKVQDLYKVDISETEHKYYLTHQIDEDYFEQQCISDECKKLGVNVGDEVKIIKANSGYFPCSETFMTETHIVTKIDGSGHVYYDNSGYYSYRPELEVINSAK